MTAISIPRRYLWIVLFAFLSACGKQTVIQPTQTSIPPAISPTPTSTVEVVFITVTPSTLPPEPTIPVFTPEQEVLKTVIQSYFDVRYLMFNSLQVDGFDDLVSDKPDAKDFLHAELGKLAVQIKHRRLNNLRYVNYKYFLDYRNIVVDSSTQVVTISLIEGNEVLYELSAKANPEAPIVSHLSGIEHTIILREEDGQWKIVSDYYNDYLWRMLRQSGTSTDEMLKSVKAVPLPTPSTIIAITPEPAQTERWREYESALAKKLMPLSPPEKVLCEWELSGRSNQQIYAWAVCMDTRPVAEISQFFFPVASIPAVIHLGKDGTVQNVEIPEYGSNYFSDIRRMFPLDVQKKVADVGGMEAHLELRREHPQEPPLIVLSATPVP